MTDTITAPESGAKLMTMVDGIRVAMFTTFGADGEAQCRPMFLQKSEMTGELWFATSRAAGVTTDLLRDDRVLLTFASPDQQTYVVVRGTAVMDHDREMIATLWNPGMKAWFPAGPTDPDLTLIHVTSETAEYWDAPAAPVRWLEFAKAVVTRGRSISGKHAALKFGL